MTKDSIQLPYKYGAVEESYFSSQAGKPAKTVIYIQDAHDSFEAQKNIAKIIRHFVKQEGVKTVFEEGYEGRVPTDKYFGLIKNPGIRKKVSYFLMDKLRIGGAEYAHINRFSSVIPASAEGGPASGGQTLDPPVKPGDDKRFYDFQLLGADNLKLHRENIQWYRRNARHRKQTQSDLAALQKEMDQLAIQYLPQEIKNWMKLKKRLESEEINLLDYLKRVAALNNSPVIARSPEGATRFATNRRRIPARPMAGGRPDESADFFGGQSPNLESTYPNLALLLAEKTKSIDTKALFREMEKLETDLAGKFLHDERSKKIFQYQKSLTLLQKLNEIAMSQAEFEALKNQIETLHTQAIAAFIVEQTKVPIVLSKRWEENIQNAIQFYETAHQRNQAIEKHLAGFFQSPDESAAVLVFGGFHKEGIKEILKKNGASYHIVVPRIRGKDKRHEMFYKQVMAVGRYPFELPLAVRTGARLETSLERWDANPLLARAELGAMEQIAAGVSDFSMLSRTMEQKLPAILNQTPAATTSSAATRQSLDGGRSEVRPLPKRQRAAAGESVAAGDAVKDGDVWNAAVANGQRIEGQKRKPEPNPLRGRPSKVRRLHSGSWVAPLRFQPENSTDRNRGQDDPRAEKPRVKSLGVQKSPNDRRGKENAGKVKQDFDQISAFSIRKEHSKPFGERGSETHAQFFVAAYAKTASDIFQVTRSEARSAGSGRSPERFVSRGEVRTIPDAESTFKQRLGRVLIGTVVGGVLILGLYFSGNLDAYFAVKAAVPLRSIIYWPAAALDMLAGILVWGTSDLVGQYLNRGSHAIEKKQTFIVGSGGIFQGLATHVLLNLPDYLPVLPWVLAQQLLRTFFVLSGGMLISLVFGRLTSLARRLLKVQSYEEHKEIKKTLDMLASRLLFAPAKTFMVINVLPPPVRVITEQLWDYLMTIWSAYLMNREGPLFVKRLPAWLERFLNSSPPKTPARTGTDSYESREAAGRLLLDVASDEFTLPSTEEVKAWFKPWMEAQGISDFHVIITKPMPNFYRITLARKQNDTVGIGNTLFRVAKGLRPDHSTVKVLQMHHRYVATPYQGKGFMRLMTLFLLHTYSDAQIFYELHEHTDDLQFIESVKSLERRGFFSGTLVRVDDGILFGVGHQAFLNRDAIRKEAEAWLNPSRSEVRKDDLGDEVLRIENEFESIRRETGINELYRAAGETPYGFYLPTPAFFTGPIFRILPLPSEGLITIVDAGSGQGIFALKLARMIHDLYPKLHARVVGIEADGKLFADSQRLLEKAQAKKFISDDRVQVQFMKGNFNQIYFRENFEAADFVYYSGGGTLEANKLVETLDRSLKENAHVVFFATDWDKAIMLLHESKKFEKIEIFLDPPFEALNLIHLFKRVPQPQGGATPRSEVRTDADTPVPQTPPNPDVSEVWTNAGNPAARIRRIFGKVNYDYLMQLYSQFFAPLGNTSVLVPAGGPNVSSVFLLTNAAKAVVIDLEDFDRVPLPWLARNPVGRWLLKLFYFWALKRTTYVADRMTDTFGLRTLLEFELERMGATNIRMVSMEHSGSTIPMVRVSFKWRHPGDGESRERVVVFIQSPVAYVPAWSSAVQEEQFDGLILKAQQYMLKTTRHTVAERQEALKEALPAFLEKLKTKAVVISDLPLDKVQPGLIEAAKSQPLLALENRKGTRPHFGYGASHSAYFGMKIDNRAYVYQTIGLTFDESLRRVQPLITSQVNRLDGKVTEYLDKNGHVLRADLMAPQGVQVTLIRGQEDFFYEAWHLGQRIDEPLFPEDSAGFKWIEDTADGILYLDRISLKPSMRGMKIGKTLIQWLAARSRAVHLDKWIAETNHPAMLHLILPVLEPKRSKLFISSGRKRQPTSLENLWRDAGQVQVQEHGKPSLHFARHVTIEGFLKKEDTHSGQSPNDSGTPLGPDVLRSEVRTADMNGENVSRIPWEFLNPRKEIHAWLAKLGTAEDAAAKNALAKKDSRQVVAALRDQAYFENPASPAVMQYFETFVLQHPEPAGEVLLDSFFTRYRDPEVDMTKLSKTWILKIAEKKPEEILTVLLRRLRHKGKRKEIKKLVSAIAAISPGSTKIRDALWNVIDHRLKSYVDRSTTAGFLLEIEEEGIIAPFEDQRGLQLQDLVSGDYLKSEIESMMELLRQKSDDEALPALNRNLDKLIQDGTDDLKVFVEALFEYFQKPPDRPARRLLGILINRFSNKMAAALVPQLRKPGSIQYEYAKTKLWDLANDTRPRASRSVAPALVEALVNPEIAPQAERLLKELMGLHPSDVAHGLIKVLSKPALASKAEALIRETMVNVPEYRVTVMAELGKALQKDSQRKDIRNFLTSLAADYPGDLQKLIDENWGNLGNVLRKVFPRSEVRLPDRRAGEILQERLKQEKPEELNRDNKLSSPGFPPKIADGSADALVAETGGSNSRWSLSGYWIPAFPPKDGPARWFVAGAGMTEKVGRHGKTKVRIKAVENLGVPAGVFVDARELGHLSAQEMDEQLDELLELLRMHPSFDLYIDGTDRYPIDKLPIPKLQQLISKYPQRVHDGLHDRAHLNKKQILLQVSFFKNKGSAADTEKTMKELKERYQIQKEIFPLEYLRAGVLKGFLDLVESLTPEKLREPVSRALAAIGDNGRWQILSDNFITAVSRRLRASYVVQWAA